MNAWLSLFASALVALPLAAGASGDFIISYWCGPDPAFDPVERYQEVAECNFNLCMPPCLDMGTGQNALALQACQKAGLKMIVGDSRILAKQPSDADFKANLDAIVSDYSHSPALAGYFVTDEPGAGAFPQLAAINAYLLSKDPQRLPFINLLPNYAPPGMLGTPTYEEYVARFCSEVKPRLLSYDHYAVMQDGTLRPGYFSNLEVIRRQALKHGIPMCSILLTIPHGPYRNPSEADIRWQVFTSVAYGANAILYFTYWTPLDEASGFHNGLIERDGHRSEHYPQVRRINSVLKAWGPTLMKLTSTGVYHTSELPEGCSGLPASLPFGVSADRPALVGLFQHEDGSKWAMVVNRDFKQPASVRISLGEGQLAESLSQRAGRLEKDALENGTVRFILQPGDARLLKISY